MSSKLPRKSHQKLHRAFLAAFRSPEALARILHFGLNVNLNEISKPGNLTDVVFEVFDWAEANGKFKDLVQAAITNSNNPKLKDAAAEYLLETESVNFPPLPRLPGDLIDREKERKDISDRLKLSKSDFPLVTLVGPPGVGKSRLRLATIHALKQRFDNRILDVPLAGLLPEATEEADTATIVREIARLLEIELPDVASTVQILRRIFRSRKTLLVLDNAEHLQTADLLTQLLADNNKHLRILVTSREMLNITNLEQVVRVEPFAAPKLLSNLTTLVDEPAVALFLHYGKQARSSLDLTAANAKDIVAICRKLDGLPLALVLAAARMRFYDTPGQLLADLRVGLLAGTDKALPYHQRVFARTVRWSYNLLAHAEDTVEDNFNPSLNIQQLFSYMALFRGAFTAAMATRLYAQLDPAQEVSLASMQLALGELADTSLIERQESATHELSYRMLQPIREWCIEKLASQNAVEAVKQAFIKSWITWVTTTNSTYARNSGSLIHAISAHYHDLEYALNQAVENRWEELLTALVTELRRFWVTANWFREGLRWFNAVLLLPNVPPSLRYKIANAAGICASELGESKDAKIYLTQALTSYNELPSGTPEWLRDVALILDHLGNAATDLGDYSEAAEYYQQSEACLAILPDTFAERSQNRYNRAYLALVQGAEYYPSATQLYQESVELMKQSEEVEGLVNSYIGLGRVLLWQGYQADAAAAFGTALSYCEPTEPTPDLIAVIHAGTELAAARSQWSEIVRLIGAETTLRQHLAHELDTPTLDVNHDPVNDLAAPERNPLSTAQKQFDPKAWTTLVQEGAAWTVARIVEVLTRLFTENSGTISHFMVP